MEEKESVETALHLIIEDAFQPLNSLADLLDGISSSVAALSDITPETVLPAIADIHRHLLEGAEKKINQAVDGIEDHVGRVCFLAEKRPLAGGTLPFEEILGVHVEGNTVNAKNVP